MYGSIYIFFRFDLPDPDLPSQMWRNKGKKLFKTPCCRDAINRVSTTGSKLVIRNL